MTIIPIKLHRAKSMVTIKAMNPFRIILALILVLSLSHDLLAGDVALRSGEQVVIRLAGVPQEDISQVSGSYTIDGAGNINLPYLGKIRALGLTQADLQNVIESSYKAKGIYSSPVVTVSGQMDRLVNIEGDVRSPQRLRYTPDLTLFAAISAAGGFTDYADQTKVCILRNGSRTIVNVKKIRQNIEADPAVQPGDQISVPRSFW